MTDKQKLSLEEAVTELAVLCGEVDMPWNSFSCTEIEALADVFRAAGLNEVAEIIVLSHARDDDEGDDHYIAPEQDELVAELLDLLGGEKPAPSAGGVTYWWALTEDRTNGRRQAHEVAIIEGYTTIEDAPKIIRGVRSREEIIIAIRQADHSQVRKF